MIIKDNGFRLITTTVLISKSKGFESQKNLIQEIISKYAISY